MNINLKSIKPTRQPKPPRLILYGTPKVGKTTFASKISNALFLDVEGGTEELNVSRIARPQLETYADIIAMLNAVLSQEHDFHSLVIDSIDFMEKVLMRQVASEFGVKEFAQINGYGREYNALVNVWRQVLQLLDDIREKRNMAIVLIAHEAVKKIKEPNTEGFDSFTLALEGKSTELLKAWADAILFAKVEVYTEQDKSKRVRATAGDRMLFTMNAPTHLAGNRYGLPAEIPFSWEAFSEAFAKAQAGE
jgi:GTPase SAR1 family protein